METIHEHLAQTIATLISLFTMILLRYVAKKVIRKYALTNPKLEARVNHVIRVFYIFINIGGGLIIITIWGVDPRNLFLAFSSIFAIIGVAFFAQWSLLSNITAGIIIFFTTPFRIGDRLRIHDKEVDFEAEVMDILTFHTHLKLMDGEIVVYPNSLFFQKGVSVIDVNQRMKLEAEKDEDME